MTYLASHADRAQRETERFVRGFKIAVGAGVSGSHFALHLRAKNSLRPGIFPLYSRPTASGA